MNQNLLKIYIEEYKRKFPEIHTQEIYKWQAVKQFQDNWDINANNFSKMLSVSLSKTFNLMDSGNYFPRKMIVQLAEKRPEVIRHLFLDLYKEENDLIERVVNFRREIKSVNYQDFPRKNDFQDHRAVLVYLTLKYPDTYFFYKYGMLKDFCINIEHSYIPQKGKSANILQFLDISKVVRDVLKEDNALIKLHGNRLGKSEYFDTSSNILTQDFIYATTEYLAPEKKKASKSRTRLTLQDISLNPILAKPYQFKGKYVDFVSKHRRNKRMGDIGEEIVLQYEKTHCDNPKYKSKIVLSAKSEGDGLGFDIKSFSNNGKPKFIEVKTTKGKSETALYISDTELKRSIQEGDNYYLYRLYNLNEEKKTADFFVLQGNLEKYCINATGYKVILEVKK